MVFDAQDANGIGLPHQTEVARFSGECPENKQIAGTAIDVFEIEPLPPDHPFRTLDNVLATPHIGYVSDGLYKTFYEDTVSNIRKWLDTH